MTTDENHQFDRQRRMSQTLYEYGSSAFFACEADARFSYCLYVPPALQQDGRAESPDLLVVIHGTRRLAETCRNQFVDFGRWNNCVILAPLFPIGLTGFDDRSGYRMLVEDDVRFDRITLSMVDEVGRKYGWSFERFGLFGFSGGGQFANRFLLCHPERLWAVTISAPGHVTLLDGDRDWWIGTRGIDKVFGRSVDAEHIRQVPVLLSIGSHDTESWEIQTLERHSNWMPGANDAGQTRPERLDALKASLDRAGLDVEHAVVRGVAHDFAPCADHSKDFLARKLASWRARRATGR